MKMTDLRAKARAIFGSANPEPMPKQPNEAKALQQRANARPIPTYKVGGVVKKADGGVMADRIAARMAAGNYKKGGSVEKKADGGLLDRVGRAMSDIANEGKTKRYGRAVAGVPRGSAGRPARNATDDAGSGSNTPVTVARREESVTVNPNPPKEKTVRLSEKPKYVKLNARKNGGKVQTSADTARKLASEMGGMKKGGKPKDGLAVMIAIGKPMKPSKKMDGGAASMRDKDMESSKVTRTMKGGGACMTGKPVKKALGGGMDAKLSRAITGAKADMARMAAAPKVNPMNQRSVPGGGMLSKIMANPKARAAVEAVADNRGIPVKRAVGGAGKTRKGQAPIKKAQGGAAKVRKGMMSPTGDIKQVVKPTKGLGGF